jgi:hypothetical protein
MYNPNEAMLIISAGKAMFLPTVALPFVSPNIILYSLALDLDSAAKITPKMGNITVSALYIIIPSKAIAAIDKAQLDKINEINAKIIEVIPKPKMGDPNLLF